MDSDTLFLVVGVIIFLGFISNYLFRRYKAPDVLILIFMGVILGPGTFGFISGGAAESIDDLTPYVASLALAVIMFQAGMDLRIEEVLHSFKRSLYQTLIAFVASMFITGAICMWLTDWNLATCLMLGAILGGTSGAIVIPIVANLCISRSMKMILTLEAAITDVLVIVVATSLIVFMDQGDMDIASGASLLLSSFLISTIVGVGAGIAWKKVLEKLSSQPFSYMITIGAMLMVFTVTNFLIDKAGGGAIAVLVFGLTLNNWDVFARYLRLKECNFELEEKVVKFNNEITFLVRTFFFVYLGLVITTIHFTAWYVLLGLIVFFGLLLARYVSLRLSDKLTGLDDKDEMGLFYMMPRGLAAAVMAAVPLSYIGVFSASTANAILGVSAMVIILSTSLASVGAFVIELHTKRTEQKVTRSDGDGL